MKNSNQRIAFYTTILNYLQLEHDDEAVVKQVIELSKGCSPSWEATEDSLAELEQYSNRGSQIVDDEQLYTLLNDFAKAAFKDLSVLKNPMAMDVFHKLAAQVVPSHRKGHDVLVWAKSLKERPDGSAVIVLHVSDLERFRKELEEHRLIDGSTVNNTLEECIQIGS